MRVERGYEADRLHRTREPAIRWWLFVDLPGWRLRDQAARKGVADNGFRFARGGRARTPAEAEAALADAERQAVAEAHHWMRQPSHMLGPRGELIPLDQVESLDQLRELTR